MKFADIIVSSKGLNLFKFIETDVEALKLFNLWDYVRKRKLQWSRRLQAMVNLHEKPSANS